MRLTFIFTNTWPMLCAGDAIKKRSVHIELTPEQEKQVARRSVGVDRGSMVYESVEVFIDNDEKGGA